MTTTTYYKIRHKVTGLYSKGGTYVNGAGNNTFWNQSGKTWDTLGKLRAHITSHLPKGTYRKGTDMSDWEVIEFHVAVKEVKSVKDIIDPKKMLEWLKGV